MSNLAPAVSEKTGQKASGLRRRKSLRHNRHLQASWRVLGARDHRFTPGTVQDISCHGIALIAAAEFKSGAILSIQLENVAERFAGPWLGRVENVRPLSDSSWVVGCALSVEFAEGELRALLESARQPLPAKSNVVVPPAPEPVADPFLQGSATERRSASRRRGQAVAVLIARANARATHIRGSVVDRSLGGLGLAAPCPLPVGTVVRIRAAHVSESTPWTPARVKSCRPSGRQWILGCQFTESLPSSVLLSFC